MNNVNKHTVDYIKHLRSNGRFAFTEDDLYKSVNKPKKNIRKDIDRLRDKRVIKNIRRGFYTIIPDEYSNSISKTEKYQKREFDNKLF